MFSLNKRRFFGVMKKHGLRWLLIISSFLLMGIFLILPLSYVIIKAFSEGWSLYVMSFKQAEARHAIYLTGLAVGFSVLCNTLFALAAIWALGKFNFKAKPFVISLIDLPFTISPVVSGLLFILLLGKNGFFGGFFLDFPLIFSLPGILLVTTFVTFPFVIREVLPLVQAQGTEEEVAALTLGANGLQTFLKVTLPNIKWGFIYGMCLCAARAAGEFGAVSVVSGHIRGQTMTTPLYIEALYNEYQLTAAYAISTLLIAMSMILIGVKQFFESKKRIRHD